MLFVIGMCALAGIGLTLWLIRKEIFGIGTKKAADEQLNS
jgi:hypothetical protein